MMYVRHGGIGLRQLNCCGVDGPPDYLHSAWFNHTTFAGGAFVPPSCCVLLNDDPRRPVYRDETQCQIEALLSLNATFGDDANVKTRVRPSNRLFSIVSHIVL